METATPLHSLRFTLRRADWAAFLRLPRPAWGWRRLLLPGFAILAGLGLAALLRRDPDWPDWLVALAVAALAGAALGLTGLVRWLDCVWRIRQKPSAQEVELQLFDDHILWIADGRRTLVPIDDLDWPAIGEEHVALFAGDAVLLVPRHAFAGRVEMGAFHARIEQVIRTIDPD